MKDFLGIRMDMGHRDSTAGSKVDIDDGRTVFARFGNRSKDDSLARRLIHKDVSSHRVMMVGDSRFWNERMEPEACEGEKGENSQDVDGASTGETRQQVAHRWPRSCP